jgi:hypothetical protein
MSRVRATLSGNDPPAPMTAGLPWTPGQIRKHEEKGGKGLLTGSPAGKGASHGIEATVEDLGTQVNRCVAERRRDGESGELAAGRVQGGL